jgi:hypothetical protein
MIQSPIHMPSRVKHEQTNSGPFLSFFFNFLSTYRQTKEMKAGARGVRSSVLGARLGACSSTLHLPQGMRETEKLNYIIISTGDPSVVSGLTFPYGQECWLEGPCGARRSSSGPSSTSSPHPNHLSITSLAAPSVSVRPPPPKQPLPHPPLGLCHLG